VVSLAIFALAGFLALAAFCSIMEIGVVSINRLRLQHLVRRRVPGAQTVRDFLLHSDRLLGTTLLGTDIAHVAASVLAAWLGRRAAGAWGAAAAGVLLLAFILLFCEYIPKAWVQASPATRVLPFAAGMRALAFVLWPFVRMLNGAMRLLGMTTGETEEAENLLVSREELRFLAEEGVASGVLTAHERKMIHGVFELPGKTVRSIMTPREKMVSVRADAAADELLEMARAHDVNRFPVYDARRKTFAGVVFVFDVLRDAEAAGKPVRGYLREALKVPATLSVDHLLPRMRVAKQEMALVTDSREEVVGLVTLEDVVEEIVGV
jgi:CBS domain containing-hemolysin-like protein